ERLEGRAVGEPGHRLVYPLLRLGPLLLGDQEVLLPAGLLDLGVELPERLLEALRLVGLPLPGLVERLRPLRVLLVAQQRLPGQVVAPLAHRQHRAALPILRLLRFLLGLRL